MMRVCSAQSVEVIAELDIWSSNLEVYNAKPIWNSPSDVRVVYSDSSEMKYGALLLSMHGLCVSHGCWELEETAHSSTWGELSAVCMVLLSMAPKLVNSQVHWFY